MLWKWGFCRNPQIFPAESKLGIKLQATITKNPLGLLLPPLQMYSEPIPPAAQHRLGHHKTFKLTLEFKLIFLYTHTHEKGTLRRPHTHCTSFLKGYPIHNHYSCHITSLHICACSWIQLTHSVPSKAARVMLWAIFWGFWPWFLICKHSYSFCPVTITQSYSNFCLPHFTGRLAFRERSLSKRGGPEPQLLPLQRPTTEKNHKNHNHRITEGLESEETFKIILFQPLVGAGNLPLDQVSQSHFPGPVTTCLCEKS